MNTPGKSEQIRKLNIDRLKRFIKTKTFTLLVLLVLIVAFFWFTSKNHSYMKLSNITSILNSMVLFALFAIAEALLIIFGEIDLAPGYIGTAAGAMMAVILSVSSIPWFIVVILCLLMGIAFGLINALLIERFGFQSFIATLAVGSFIAKGFSYIVSGGKSITVSDPVIVWLGTGKIAGAIPVAIIISLAALIIYGIILAKTKFGRSIYLCGGNKQAALQAGLNPKKLSYILFANSGMLGALAGIICAARLKSGNLDGTNHYAFPAITAVILGGVSFGGGSGNMFGCFLGLLIINGFNNGLTILRVSPFWQSVASGLLLLLALTMDYISKRRLGINKRTGRRKTSGTVS